MPPCILLPGTCQSPSSVFHLHDAGASVFLLGQSLWRGTRGGQPPCHPSCCRSLCHCLLHLLPLGVGLIPTFLLSAFAWLLVTASHPAPACTVSPARTHWCLLVASPHCSAASLPVTRHCASGFQPSLLPGHSSTSLLPGQQPTAQWVQLSHQRMLSWASPLLVASSAITRALSDACALMLLQSALPLQAFLSSVVLSLSIGLPAACRPPTTVQCPLPLLQAPLLFDIFAPAFEPSCCWSP